MKTLNKKHVGRKLEDIKSELLKNPEFRLEWNHRMQVREAAELIKNLRESADLTQRELAERLGVAQTVIARLEGGDPRRRPRLDTLSRIAAVCGRRLVLSVV